MVIPVSASPSITGRITPKFLLNTDAHRTGPGGFAAHINNICALRDHALRVGESVVRGVVFTAVTEESGVTFRIPITRVRSAAAASQGRCAGGCGLIIACMIQS